MTLRTCGPGAVGAAPARRMAGSCAVCGGWPAPVRCAVSVRLTRGGVRPQTPRYAEMCAHVRRDAADVTRPLDRRDVLLGLSAPRAAHLAGSGEAALQDVSGVYESLSRQRGCRRAWRKGLLEKPLCARNAESGAVALKEDEDSVAQTQSCDMDLSACGGELCC